MASVALATKMDNKKHATFLWYPDDYTLGGVRASFLAFLAPHARTRARPRAHGVGTSIDTTCSPLPKMVQHVNPSILRVWSVPKTVGGFLKARPQSPS